MGRPDRTPRYLQDGNVCDAVQGAHQVGLDEQVLLPGELRAGGHGPTPGGCPVPGPSRAGLDYRSLKPSTDPADSLRPPRWEIPAPGWPPHLLQQVDELVSRQPLQDAEVRRLGRVSPPGEGHGGAGPAPGAPKRGRGAAGTQRRRKRAIPWQRRDAELCARLLAEATAAPRSRGHAALLEQALQRPLQGRAGPAQPRHHARRPPEVLLHALRRPPCGETRDVISGPDTDGDAAAAALPPPPAPGPGQPRGSSVPRHSQQHWPCCWLPPAGLVPFPAVPLPPARAVPCGVQRFRSRRLYSLSASLTSLARRLQTGACSICSRFRSILGKVLSSVTSSTTRRTSAPKHSSISENVVSVSSTVSCRRAACGEEGARGIAGLRAEQRERAGQGRAGSYLQHHYVCHAGLMRQDPGDACSENGKVAGSTGEQAAPGQDNGSRG